MNTGWKKVLALGLGLTLAAGTLAGCGKKAAKETAAITVNDSTVTDGELNFLLRYQQAHFETTYGSLFSSLYGGSIDLWSQDLTGTGVPYGETLKEQTVSAMQEMLLAEQHMEEYGVSLTDDEKAQITSAAESFIAANGEEALEAMGATQENVERVLTLYTIRNKMEAAMTADVDTEVSDEEAAQTTVSYVKFNAETEAPEPETEAVSEVEELLSETELLAETQEDLTEAGLEAQTEVRTKASPSETEIAEQLTEAAEAVVEGETEAGTEAEEVETESPEMIAARAQAQAQAEAFLAEARTADDWAALMAETADAADDDNITSGSYTFGADSTYPDAAIIAAAAGHEDGELADEVVAYDTGYYVIHVDDAFDEEATAQRKEAIVSERKQEALTALYETWTGDAEISVDAAVFAGLTFANTFLVETEAAEAVTEAAEAVTEAVTESGTEAVR